VRRDLSDYKNAMTNNSAIPAAGGNQRHASQLIHGCSHCIEQCKQLLDLVEQQDYVASTTASASVGAHVRHILDRYHCFFAGLQSGHIDYDDRKRDKSIETNLEAAQFALNSVARRIEDPQLASSLRRSVTVRESVHFDEPAVEVETRIDRELMALITHSIHHLAIISLVIRPLGYTMEADFGKAASTILFERS
jgi:uncharacterized damage-inducible protein DinB